MQLALNNLYVMCLIDDLHARLYAEALFAVGTTSVLSVEVIMPDRFADSVDANDWYAVLPAILAEDLDPMTGWVLMDVTTPSHEHPNLLIRLRGRNPLEMLCDAPPTSP
jgi:hypothetical protein